MIENHTNIEVRLAAQQALLIRNIQQALVHAPLTEVENGEIINTQYQSTVINSSDITRYSIYSSVGPHEVYLPEEDAHLYPWFIVQSYRTAGYTEGYIRQIQKEKTGHEFGHFARSLNVDDPVTRKLGVSFFLVGKVDGKHLSPFRHVVWPNFITEGEMKVVDHMTIGDVGDAQSTNDRRLLHQLAQIP